MMLIPSTEIVVLSRAANTLKDILKASVLVVKWGVDLETGSGSGQDTIKVL
jgi:hypothetical protein